MTKQKWNYAERREQLLTRQSQEIAALRDRMARLEAACQAVLLYHGGMGWREEQQNQWRELTGKGAATTKVLYDMVRAALSDTPVNKEIP
jgi:hypothetical protein